MSVATPTERRRRTRQDTQVVVVWDDSVEPGGSSPLWVSVRYPDTTATPEDRDVIIVEVSAQTEPKPARRTSRLRSIRAVRDVA